MALNPGVRLGPYEIVTAIGAGGMGEVYKARDTRLDRTVAIKIISSLVAASPELRDRFEREARTVSQLNHPNICTLHDVGHEGGTEYLVLEHLEGEALSDRLSRGPVPLRDALSIAAQICDALDKAHRAGIVHRDLKPGNVFLVRGATASAPPTAKLLDFGLAKTAATPAATSGVNLPGAPTVTTPLTAQGTILGTFQYMAPEQLEGDEADARTDIWAFGCVLYEMLSGKKAFAGRTHASLISSIMGTQPAPVADAIPDAPPVVDHIIRTCLAKDPAERFQTAHDLLLQLRWISSTDSRSGIQPPVRRTRRVHPALLAAGGAAVLLATAGGTWLLTRPRPVPAAVTARMVVTLPRESAFALFGSANLAISPDGMRLVYAGTDQQSSSLFARAIDRFERPVPIAGTTDALMPFFSPDGAWVGFFSGGKLKKVPAGGGAATIICDMLGPTGATWTPDGTIVFAHPQNGTLMRVGADGGEPVPVTTLEGAETAHRWPVALPDGSLLFAANTGGNWSDAQIVVQPADGGARRLVIQAGSSPRYLATGHLMFARGDAAYVVPFDARRFATTGVPKPITDAIGMTDTDGRAQFAVSSTGTLAYVVSAVEHEQRALVWVNRDGTSQTLAVEGRPFDHPRISPDGRHVAVTVRGTNPDVWLLDLSRNALSRFTVDNGEDESAVWSADGSRLTYAATRAGRRATFWKPIDNSGPEEELFATNGHQHLSGWTADGRALVIEEINPTFGLYVGSTAGRKVTPLVQTRFTEAAAHLSRDGKWIAYSSNESGRNEVYVQAFPGPGGRVQVSVDGGGEARWSPDGREVFYRKGDRMMAVSIEYTPSPRPGPPRVLFEGRYARIAWGQANYDVHPDGRRFLMIKGDEQPLPTEIHVVTNWFEELRGAK